MPTLSSPELIKLSHTLARALSVDEVNQLGRNTGQAQRLRTVTPHRLFLAIVSTLGSGRAAVSADILQMPARVVVRRTVSRRRTVRGVLEG